MFAKEPILLRQLRIAKLKLKKKILHEELTNNTYGFSGQMSLDYSHLAEIERDIRQIETGLQGGSANEQG